MKRVDLTRGSDALVISSVDKKGPKKSFSGSCR